MLWFLTKSASVPQEHCDIAAAPAKRVEHPTGNEPWMLPTTSNSQHTPCCIYRQGQTSPSNNDVSQNQDSRSRGGRATPQVETSGHMTLLLGYIVVGRTSLPLPGNTAGCML